MRLEYDNGSGQRQPYFYYDYYVLDTDEWQRVRLLWKSFCHDQEICAYREKDCTAEADSFATFCRDEEADEDQDSDQHAWHHGEDKKMKGLAADDKAQVNLDEWMITASGKIFLPCHLYHSFGLTSAHFSPFVLQVQ